MFPCTRHHDIGFIVMIWDNKLQLDNTQATGVVIGVFHGNCLHGCQRADCWQTTIDHCQ
jgi:hypothetical protein